ncbi:hypothetical protein D9M72_457230 [compost metagenome]
MSLAQGSGSGLGGLGPEGGLDGGPGPSGLLGNRGGRDTDQGQLVVGVGLVRFGQFGTLDVLHHLRDDAFCFLGTVNDHYRDQGPSGFDGGAGAALAHQDVDSSVVFAVGDHGFHHAVFLDAGDEIGGQSGIFPDVDVNGEGCRVEHFERGCCVHGFCPCRDVGGSGGLGDRPASLSPRRFYVCQAAGNGCGRGPKLFRRWLGRLR